MQQIVIKSPRSFKFVSITTLRLCDAIYQTQLRKSVSPDIQTMRSGLNKQGATESF